MSDKVFKFNTRNVIAALLALLMIASAFVTSFGTMIVLAASDDGDGTAVVETNKSGEKSDDEGEPTRTIVANNGSVSGTGKLSSTQASSLFGHVEVRYGSSGSWKQRSVRFRFKHTKPPEWYRGSNANPQWSTLSGNSGDMPDWNEIPNNGGSYSNNSLFDDMDNSCTHWLYLKKTDADNQGYRATCLDPAFNRWANGAIPVNEAAYVVRIDAESESNSSVPLEYKLMRRIIWYSYFGGVGMAHNYNSTGYTDSANKLNAIFGTSSNSIRSQYVFLHMAASLISDVSVAKSKISGSNYNSTYPALGVAASNGHYYNSSITVNPEFTNTSGVNNSYFPTTSTISNLTGAGWNVTYNNGKHTLSSTARNRIINYVNDEIKPSSAGSNVPEGFVVYVFVSKASSQYQTFVVYTIETAAKVRVHKQNTSGVSGVSLPSGTNGQGAVYGVYKTYADAESNTGSVATLTIGNDGYSNIYYHTFAITLFSATPPSSCPAYNLYIKEISPPTSTPDGWAWTLDPTIYTVNTPGWQCGGGTPVVEIPVTTVDSTEKLWPPRYFKLGKVSDDGNISSAGTTFKIYTNSNCTTLATGLQYLNGSTWTDLTWTGSTANGLAVSSSATNGVYYTPVIRIKDVTNSNDVSFYFKEVNKPTANQSNWSSVTYNPSNSSGTCGKIMVASTNSTQATAATATAYNHYTIPEGYMRIHKTSSPAAYNNKVNGAKYGIYRDAACQIKATDVLIYNGTEWVECNGIVTISGATTANGGYSPVILVPMEGGSNSRTLYVKEISAPTTNPSSSLGWVMDPNVYTVTVNAGVHTESQPVMVDSVNTTATFPKGYMRIKKQVASGITTSPAGARYGVYATAADAQSDTNRLTTLTIGSTPGNGVWYSGWYQVTLTNGAPVTRYVKEVGRPTANLPSGDWVLDPTVYAFTITVNNPQSNPVEVVSTNSSVMPKYAALSIYKTAISNPNTGVSPEGAQFRIWRVVNGAAVVATEVGNNGVLTIGANGHSELSWIQYSSDFTGSDIFYFEEITLPSQTVDDEGNPVYWAYTLDELNNCTIGSGTDTAHVMGSDSTHPYYVQVTPKVYDQLGDYMRPGGLHYMDPADPSTWWYGTHSHGVAGNTTIIGGNIGGMQGNNKLTWSVLGAFQNEYEGSGAIWFILKKNVPSGISPDGEAYSAEGATFGVYASQEDAENNVNLLTTVVIGCDHHGFVIGQGSVVTHYDDRSELIKMLVGHNYYYDTVDGVTGYWSDLYIKELSGPTQTGNFRWNLDTNVYRMQCYVSTGINAVHERIPSYLDDATLANMAPEVTSHTVNNTWPTNTVTTIRPGYFNIQKSLAAGSGYTGTPNFAGATYGIYTSYLGAATQDDNFLATNIFDSGNNNINGIITLNSSGTAVNGPLHLDIGYDNSDTVTLYVREKTVPTAAPTNYQWLLDPTVYTITVPINRVSNPAIVSVEDLLTAKYGYFRLDKELPEGLAGISVSGAQYTVYNSYDPDTGTLSNPATDITKYTSISNPGTVSNGIITFGNNTTGPTVKVTLNIVGGGASQSGSGTGSGRRDGRAGSDVLLPSSDEQIAMRVLYVKETRLPTTSENASGRLLLDERVYTIIIYADNTTSNPVVIVSHEPGELKRQGELMVHKNIIGGPSDLSPAGIQYKVYASANDAERDRNSLGTMTLDADGVSNIVTLDLGYNDEGTYYVKEDLSTLPTVPGYSWTPDTEIHEVVVYANDIVDEPSTVESDNALESTNGSAYIQKVNRTGLYDPYDPTGAVYGIYNDERCRTLATDIGNGGYVTIQAFPGRTDMIYRTPTFDVPMLSGNSRTIYVKEVTLPTYNRDGSDDPSWSWVIDTTVYQIDVTAGSTTPQYIVSTNDYHSNDTNKAYLKVTKTVTGGNISPVGAVYKVYSDSTCETLLGVADLVTDANGVSNTVEIDLGYNTSKTVWVKEYSAPSVPSGSNYEWVMDTTAHEATLTVGSNGTVSGAYNVQSTNSIRYTHGHVMVHKDVPTGYSAEGAVFKMYYSRRDALSGANERGTLTIGANGDSNVVQVSFASGSNQRVVYIKEVSAPSQTEDGFEWVWDDTVYEVTVTYQNDPEANAAVLTVTNSVRITRGYMYVTKTAPTGYFPEGAVYGIYNNYNSSTGTVSGLATDIGSNGYVTIGSNGNSPIVQVPFTSPATSRTVYIKEISVPTQTGNFQWIIDETVYELTVTDANNPATLAAAAHITSDNDIETPQSGYIKITKTLQNPPTGAYTYDLSGAVYTVYTSDPNGAGTPTIATDVGNNGRVTITRVQTGGRVSYEVGPIEVPLGYTNSRTLWIKETGLPTDPYIYDSNHVAVYSIGLDPASYQIVVTPGNTSSSPVTISSNEPTIVISNPVYMKVQKRVPTGFSGEGAVYRVYETEADANAGTNHIAELTIGPDGMSGVQSWNLDGTSTKTVYVKEYSAPPIPANSNYQWIMDNTVYTVTMTVSNNGTPSTAYVAVSVNSVDYTGGYIRIDKILVGLTIGANPEGATYRVYTDSAATQPLMVNGAYVDLTVGANGVSDVVFIPFVGSQDIRTVYVREIATPGSTYDTFQWELDPTIHPVTVEPENTYPNPEIIDSEEPFAAPRYGYIKLVKQGPGGSFDVAGAQYTIYQTYDPITGALSDVATTLGDHGVVTIEAHGNERYVIIEVPLGFDSSRTYYIHETGLPTQDLSPTHQWEWDTNTYTAVVTPGHTSDVPLVITSTDDVTTIQNPVYMKVRKTVPSGFDGAGAKYGIFDSAAAAADADENAVVGQNGCLNIVTIGAGGLSETVSWSLDGVTSKTVYVKEIQAPPIPSGSNWVWDIDTQIYTVTMTISANGTASTAYIVSSSDNIRYTHGYLYVHKDVPSGTIPHGAVPFSPEGAVYRVYTDSACTQLLAGVGDLTISSNGDSNTVLIPFESGMNSRTVWVKEVSGPTQTSPYFTWTIDAEGHEVMVTSANSPASMAAHVNSADYYTLTEFSGYLIIYKSVPNGYSAQGAQYTVYEDSTCETVATDIGANGVITIGANGNSGNIAVPLGNNSSRELWIKETRVPTSPADSEDFEWTIDSEVYHVTVTSDNDGDSPVRIDSTDGVRIRNKGYLRVHKTVANAQFTPLGAEYSVYRNATDAENRQNAIHVFTIMSDSLSDVWEIDFGLTTPGATNSVTYYVRETSVPPRAVIPGMEFNWDWELDETIYTVTVTDSSTESNPVMVESTDRVEWLYGYLKVHKTVPSGYQPTGAVYGAFDTAAHAASADANAVVGTDGCLGLMTIGSDGDSNAIKIYFADGESSATVYVKELSGPTQAEDGFRWTLDTEVHEVTVDYEDFPATNAEVVNSSDNVEYPNSGALNVHKTAPAGFSPEGATYGVFESMSDAQNRTNAVHTFTIGENGYATAWSVDLQYDTSKTYYIRELTAPADTDYYVWEIDDAIYTKVVTQASDLDHPVMVESEDDIQYVAGYLYVHKSVPSGYQPTGAVYGVFDTEAHANSATSDAVVGQDGCLGLMTITAGGDSNVVRIPFVGTATSRTVYVKELSGPTQAENGFRWDLDDTVYTATVTYEHAPAANAIRVDSFDDVELPNSGKLNVHKTVPAGFNPAGAVYEVYETMADAENKTNAVHSFTIDSTGYGEVWIIDLQYESSKTYYIREVTTPSVPADSNFVWNTDETIYTKVVTPASGTGTPVMVESNDTITYTHGYLYVHKDVPAGHMPTGAVYGIYPTAADAAADTNAITTVTIGSNGDSETVEIPFIGGADRRTVYVKEISGPTETDPSFSWDLDEDVHEATVTYQNNPASAAVRVDSFDDVTDIPRNAGFLNVYKTGPLGFSVAGATYGLYATMSDAENNTNLIHTFVIGDTGYATAYGIDLGYETQATYYVRELSGPTVGADSNVIWMLDSTIYAPVVTAGSTNLTPVIVTSHDDNYYDHGYLYVHKTVPAENVPDTGTPFSPIGAVYGVYPTAADADAGTNAIGTVTIGIGGNSEVIEIPFIGTSGERTVYVKEISGPTQAEDGFRWTLDETVYSVTVTGANSPAANAVRVDSHDEVELPNTGWLNVHKTSPEGFSPEGATYGVFESMSDAEAKTNPVHIFTIGETGYGTAWSVYLGYDPSKTYYVCELTAPADTDYYQWSIDANIYTVTVDSSDTPAEPEMVESNDTITYVAGYLKVYKQVPAGHSGAGAVYKVYTDAACTQPLAGVPDLVIGADGYSNVVKIPFLDGETSRTVWVKEYSKPSETEDGFMWNMDETHYEVLVTYENAPESNAIMVSSYDTITLPQSAYLNVHKTAPAGFSPEGAVYEVYESEADAIAGTNAVHTFTIGADGYGTLWTVDMQYDATRTYYIKEISLPTYTSETFTWVMDTTIHVAPLTAGDSIPVMVESTNTVEDVSGFLKVHKTAPAGYSPEGAVYRVFTDAECETPLTGIADLVIGANGDSQTVEIEFPADTYGMTVYVLEVQKPTQAEDGFEWHMDPVHHEVEVTYQHPSDQPAMVNSVNTIEEHHEGTLNVHKTVPAGHDPSGAVYTAYLSYEDAVNGVNGVHEFTIGTNGYAEAWTVELGTDSSRTYYVKETAVPVETGDFLWDMDLEIHEVSVGIDQNVMVESHDEIRLPSMGYVQVHKNVDNGGNPAGAQYTIYEDADCTIPATNVTPNVLTIGANGDSELAEVRIGFESSRTLYVKETRLPSDSDGFEWGFDTSIYTVVITSSATASQPVVVISDEPAYTSLKVAKTVSGNLGDKTKLFRFVVTVEGATGTYNTVMNDGTTGTVTFVDNAVSFQLSHGQWLSINGLPYGANYAVTEVDYENYTVTVVEGPAAGVLNGNAYVLINNYLGKPVPTGISLTMIGLTTMIVSGVGLTALKIRRKSEND